MDDEAFRHVDRLTEREITKGVHVRILPGQKVMFTLVRFDPNATVPTHSHPHEQLGMILEGEMDMWIGDERRHLHKGNIYAIPPNQPHGAQTRETTCLVIDAFHPLREDYLKLFRA